MRLLQRVEFNSLEKNKLYKITKKSLKEYHVGYFAEIVDGQSIDAVLFYASKNGKVSVFRNVERYYNFNPLRKIYYVCTEYFDGSCIYHRIVSKVEQKKAYAAAFEKRAVNQIIASIVKHPGNFY